ncbi:MAG: site-specific integrase [Oscillospiraceae bacterium]|nr:site-specific integrase [Oscillospiraceae bacterium]
MSRVKQPNGSGTIKLRPNGLWEARFWATMPDGHRKRVSKYARRKRDCLTWLTEMRFREQNGEVSSESNLTLIAWMCLWLKEYVPGIRNSTRAGYAAVIYRHLAAHRIAGIKLKSLTTDDLQQFFNFLMNFGRLDGRGGLSAKTVRNVYLVLHKALSQAVGNRLIRLNPADFVALPKIQRTEIQLLTDEEVQNLLAVCSGERWEAGMVILLFCGLRLSEMLALRAGSLVELDGRHYMKVEFALKREQNVDALEGQPKTTLKLGELKTEGSRRLVPLLPEVFEIIMWNLAHQQEDAARSYELYEGNPFIVSNELGGYVDSTTFRKFFKQMLAKAGITRRVRIHDCRHFFCSLAVRSASTAQNGADLALVKKCLGHSVSSAVTEQVYLHATAEDQFRLAESMHQTVAGLVSQH